MNVFTIMHIGQPQVFALGWLLAAAVVGLMVVAVGGLACVMLLAFHRDQQISRANHRRALALAILGEDELDEEDDELGGSAVEAPTTPHQEAPQFALPAAALNTIQVATIRDLVRSGKHASTIDAVLRINGDEIRFEADWIKQLVELCVPDRTSSTMCRAESKVWPGATDQDAKLPSPPAMPRGVDGLNTQSVEAEDPAGNERSKLRSGAPQED